MTSPTFRSALLAFALGALAVTSACVEDDGFDEGNGDNSDVLDFHADLLGFDEVSYEFVGDPVFIVRSDKTALSVKPEIELDEEANTFITKTTQIHHKYRDPIELSVHDIDYSSWAPEDSDDDDRFGMHLEVLWHDRENDETEWIKMNIGDFDSTYAWKSLKVKRIPNANPEFKTSEYVFTGIVAHYEKANFSAPHETLYSEETVSAYGHDLEFRVAVVPLYSEYNWDRSYTPGFELEALVEAHCIIGGRGVCEYDPRD